MQFYPADWRKDPGVQALTFHQRGVWFELICLMHESPRRGYLLLPNGTAMTDDAISRVIGLDKQNLTTTLTAILDCGVTERDPETGALINRRMIRDERLRQTRAECGKLGGNPNLLNQAANHKAKQNTTTHVNQNPTPSFSSSISSSPSVNTNTPLTPLGGTDEATKSSKPVRAKKTKPTVEDAKLVAVPESLARSPTFMSQWRAWLEWRWNEKKAPLTPGSVAERLKSFETYGPERSEKAMRRAIANSWVGVFPEKETIDDGSASRNQKHAFSRFDEETVERNAREFIERHGDNAT